MTITRRGMGLWLTAAFGAGMLPRLPALGSTDFDPLALVDEELRAGAQLTLSHPQPAWSDKMLPEARSLWPAPPRLPPPAPTVEERTIPGHAGDPAIGIQLIGAGTGGKPRPAVLHIHGGGYIVGRAEHMTAFCQQVSAEFDCVVVNVEYRLAPETRFPGPLEDNYAALLWLFRNASSLGVDPRRIAVMGESAGGGLAAMVAIAARDRREVPLRYQVLLYPMLDDRTGSTRPMPRFMGAVGWDAAGNRYGWTSLLGVRAGSREVPVGAVPARLSNLAGLAPAFIGVGDIDLFAEEDIDYARRLVHAGVPTTFHLAPGAYHAFDFVVPEARVSRAFTEAWKAALRRAFE